LDTVTPERIHLHVRQNLAHLIDFLTPSRRITSIAEHTTSANPNSLQEDPSRGKKRLAPGLAIGLIYEMAF
jgi:hypothetical protein